jgi:DNA-binding XRE family transcriptional regulator
MTKKIKAGKTLEEMLHRLPTARREKVMSRANELIKEEMTLRQVRAALQITQVDLAKELNVGQHVVSRYEKQTDMLLSTMEKYVAALGGELTLTVTFPDRKPLKLKKLADVAA